MSAPYPVGSRVVCPDPTGRWFVGVVHQLLLDGDFVVTDGAGYFRVSAGEVRPVMPRSMEDLKRWGRWWWYDRIPLDAAEVLRRRGDDMYDDGRWSGPVQPPPEVRS